jgi:hypothetical protein
MGTLSYQAGTLIALRLLIPVLRLEIPMFETKKATAARDAWKVAKVETKPEKSGWLETFRRRRQPSTYQRCLAVHILFAGPRSGLS